ncbi:hypothetical protein HS1genome_1764 [Sulfodiicoccus acidiphilus]|uniref:CRISPR type III-associated protein domain-containing protein n=1 Tax=Sulfodiicoccus acidiphilus TaxID=1670455 RepID=A0A348B5C3_9CREN|nr:RAMP superfamily CRISPR-associated protein [Sulfodiicoccus acidiphilus]BBD73375.1 hypothetical protein HS1genome_1764 [Sulfodiicoccus acidiphilus]GGU00991.1 hypothetical protein GCM10007116_17840 [Sulfodiicoccus acidiphilus]
MELEVVSDYLHVGQGKREVLLKPVNDVEAMVRQYLERGQLPDLDDHFVRGNPFMRVAGRLTVPGSTLKGAVRTRLEMSIKDACYVTGNQRGVSSSPRYRQIFRPDPNRGSDNYLSGRAIKGNAVCPVCDLMGSPGLASRVSFSDAYYVSGQVVNVTNKEDGSSYEVAKRGSKFRGEVLLWGSALDLGMVLYGLGVRCSQGRPFSKTILLGRFKYDVPQFGRVKFSTDVKDPCTPLGQFVKKFSLVEVNEEWMP